jgi:hypothetical protein
MCIVLAGGIFIPPVCADAKTYPPNLTSVQKYTLHEGYIIGNKILHRPYLVQAALLTESSLGARRSQSSSIGDMQIKVVAAQSVFNHYPSIKYKYLKHHSINNISMIVHLLNIPADNIELGTYYLKWLITEAHGNINKAISWYNTGRYTPYYNVDYVSRIRYNERVVKQYDHLLEDTHVWTRREKQLKESN